METFGKLNKKKEETPQNLIFAGKIQGNAESFPLFYPFQYSASYTSK